MNERELEDLKNRALKKHDKDSINKLVDYFKSIDELEQAKAYESLLSLAFDSEKEETEDTKNIDDTNRDNFYNNIYSKDSVSVLKNKEDNKDPYAAYELANRYENDKDYNNALSHYNKAISLLKNESGLTTYDLDKCNIYTKITEILFILKNSTNNDTYDKQIFDNASLAIETSTLDKYKVDAYRYLGRCYKEGIGCEKDEDKANFYIQNSDNKSIEGCLNQSKKYEDENKITSALEWLEKARDKDEIDDNNNLIYKHLINFKFKEYNSSLFKDDDKDLCLVLLNDYFKNKNKLNKYLSDRELNLLLDDVKSKINDSDYENNKMLYETCLYDLANDDFLNYVVNYTTNDNNGILSTITNDEIDNIYNSLINKKIDGLNWLNNISSKNDYAKSKLEALKKTKENKKQETLKEEKKANKKKNAMLLGIVGIILVLVVFAAYMLFIKGDGTINSDSEAYEQDVATLENDLTKLDMFESDGFSIYESVTSTSGDEYTNTIVGLATYSGYKGSYVIYNLNKEYIGIELSAILIKNSNNNGLISVYGDGNELYMGLIEANSNGISVNLNLKNVKELKIWVYGCDIVLTNTNLHTDEEFINECLEVEKKTNIYDIAWINSSYVSTYENNPVLMDSLNNKIIKPLYHTSNDKESYLEIYNSKNYSSLSGKLYFLLTSKMDEKYYEEGCTLNIYGDNNLLYSYTIKNQEEPVSFDVDISNVDKLKIEILRNGDGYIEINWGWALGDVYFR